MSERGSGSSSRGARTVGGAAREAEGEREGRLDANKPLAFRPGNTTTDARFVSEPGDFGGRVQQRLGDGPIVEPMTVCCAPKGQLRHIHHDDGWLIATDGYVASVARGKGGSSCSPWALLSRGAFPSYFTSPPSEPPKLRTTRRALLTWAPLERCSCRLRQANAADPLLGDPSCPWCKGTGWESYRSPGLILGAVVCRRLVARAVSTLINGAIDVGYDPIHPCLRFADSSGHYLAYVVPMAQHESQQWHATDYASFPSRASGRPFRGCKPSAPGRQARQGQR